MSTPSTSAAKKNDTSVVAVHPAASTMDLPPVVLDLGRARSKAIKALKEGKGRMIEDVGHTMEAVRSNLGAEVEGKVLVPIVIIYEKRTARRRGLLPFFFLR
jgi:hypothetical protein